jgi:HK97 family phage prohead protease
VEIERRSMVTELRVTDGAEGKAPVLGGYAAVFDKLSLEMGSAGKRFKERLMPGAFRATLLSGDEVLAFYHHGLAGGMMGATMPLGSTRDGSLRLSEDAHGLAFALDLPETTQGKDLAVLARRGTVRGASFAFARAKDSWHRDETGLVRTVHEIEGLQDVSPTHSPAYEETVIAVRSLEAWARATSSSGEVSFEQKQQAIEAALEQLLGKRWTEEVETWYVIATFDSSVVVEQSGKMQSYPITWTGTTPTLGKPVPVDQVFEEAAQAKRAAAKRARHLRLLEIDG